MNLYVLSDFIRALAEHQEVEEFPATFAEEFLLKSFTHCIKIAGFPPAYLLAISDVSSGLFKFASNELDDDELFKVVLSAEELLKDYEASIDIDTSALEDVVPVDDTEEPLEGPDDVIFRFDDNEEVPF